MNKDQSMLTNFDEIADAIWLLIQVARFDKRIDLSKYTSQDKYLPEVTTSISDELLEPKKPNYRGMEGGDVLPVYPDQVDVPSVSTIKPKIGSIAFTPKKTISSLSIQRALRPLKLMVSSRSLPLEVNLDESLYQMAKNELANLKLEAMNKSERVSIWQNIPVFQLGMEKWLDLVFIVDSTSPAMKLFEKKVSLFKRAIMESGIFRRVDEYCLDISNNSSPKIRKPNDTKEIGFSEILIPTSRKVFWIVSNCDSSLWDNWELDREGQIKSIGDVFNKISDYHPSAIVQLMPEELWSRTGLSLHELCKSWATTPLSPNKHLKTSVINQPQDGFAIPVLSLSSQRLSPWADMIAGRVTDKAVLSIFVRTYGNKRWKRPLDVLLEKGGYGALVDIFNATVSHQANLYAAYLSVLPSLSFNEIIRLSKEITPSLTEDEVSEIISNLISSKLYNFILGSNERIVSGLNSDGKKALRKSILYSKQLEVMAEFYNCGIVPKFLDNNGNEIEFWIFVDENPKVGNLDDNRVNETYNVFQDVIVRPKTSTDQESNATTTQSIRRPPDVNFGEELKVSAVNNYNQKYLELEYFDVSLWGFSGSGKTSMLLSMPRQGRLDGYNIRRVDHYGNYISSKHLYTKKPLVFPTSEEEDYLYYIDGHPDLKQNKLLCFHDFPGNNTISLKAKTKISYKHSQAIFICLESEKVWSDGINEDREQEHIYELLSWLDFERIQPYIAICLTKTDILADSNIETFNNIPPWTLVEKFLGKYATMEFRQRDAEVFTLSAWGTKREWAPRKTFMPVEGFLKRALTNNDGEK